MYNHNITIAEYSDYIADMAELAGMNYQPTNEEVEQVIRSGSNIIYDYPTETCIIWEKTPNLLYAKWVSKLGLY